MTSKKHDPKAREPIDPEIQLPEKPQKSELSNRWAGRFAKNGESTKSPHMHEATMHHSYRYDGSAKRLQSRLMLVAGMVIASAIFYVGYKFGENSASVEIKKYRMSTNTLTTQYQGEKRKNEGLSKQMSQMQLQINGYDTEKRNLLDRAVYCERLLGPKNKKR